MNKQPLLSILIPTVESRKEKFNALLRMIHAQVNALSNPEIIEVLTLCDDGVLSVGAKRNKLLDAATGLYLCFIDDDDRIFGDYIERIIKALETRPDSVGLTLFWTDDIYIRLRLLVRSAEYKVSGSVDFRPDHPSILYGFASHLCPCLSTIAKSERFPDINAGEDTAWNAKIAPKLKTWVNIDEPIYHYNFLSGGTLTQRPSPKRMQRPDLPPGHQYVMRDGKVVELDQRGIPVPVKTSTSPQINKILNKKKDTEPEELK